MDKMKIMSDSKKVFYLLLSMFGIVIVPYIGAYIHLDGIFDQHYFDFPALKPEEVFKDLPPAMGGFNWMVFITVAVVFVLTL